MGRRVSFWVMVGTLYNRTHNNWLHEVLTLFSLSSRFALRGSSLRKPLAPTVSLLPLFYHLHQRTICLVGLVPRKRSINKSVSCVQADVVSLRR